MKKYKGKKRNKKEDLLKKVLVGNHKKASFPKTHTHIKDIKFLLTDGEVDAVKKVLCEKSEFFRAMFTGVHQFNELQSTVTMSCSKKIMEIILQVNSYFIINHLNLLQSTQLEL